MSGDAPALQTGTQTVLLIDDEPQIHRFLRPTLEAAGYAVLRAENGAQALQAAASHPPSLVLLDLGLPDMDGKELLQRLQAFCRAPVIILSARDRPAEKIATLDQGACDYVEKPFDMGEMMARIRVALRHSAPAAEMPPVFNHPPLEVDMSKREVRVNGDKVPLTPREYELLALLARNSDRVLTHRQLLVSVWGPAHAHDIQYLRVYIGHLRQKLGEAAASFLRTEAGVGYKLASGES